MAFPIWPLKTFGWRFKIKNLYQSLLLHKSNFPIKKVYFFLTTKFCNSGYYTEKMLLAVKNVLKIMWNWFSTLFPEIFKICNLPMWAMHRAYIHRAYIHTYTGHMCTGHTYTHRAYIQIAYVANQPTPLSYVFSPKMTTNSAGYLVFITIIPITDIT